MSRSSLFEEHGSANDAGIEFPTMNDAQFVFEEKNMVYTEGDQVQNEFEVQLEEEGHSDISATVLWKHVVKGKKCGNAHGGSHVFKCKHCQKVYHGTYTRVYGHLMGHKKGESKGIGYCSVVKADKNLQRLILREVEQAENSPNIVSLKKSKLSATSNLTSSQGQGPSLALSDTSPLDKDHPTPDRDDVDSRVMRCLCANGIPFDVLRSPYWEEMISSISKTSSYKSPTYERARTVLLENEKDKIERELDDFKQKWPYYGISIMSNGWNNVKSQSFINFLATNQFGSMFLRALDVLMVKKSQKSISACMLEAINKVGPYNVVQLITDNAANCKAACEEVGKAYPHMFWSPCMVHTMKLILKDTIRGLPWLERTYSTAKGVAKYIIYHYQVVEIFRSYRRLELLKVAAIKGASHYIILQLLFNVRDVVRAAVFSNEWEGWAAFPNLDEKVKMSGDEVKEAVVDDNFWDGIQLALPIIKPLYKMLKFTDQDGPIIGEVCERMDIMLGEIKDSFHVQQDMFMFANAVHSRWNKRSVPLQCLACALTPKYYDEEYLQFPAPDGRKRLPPDQDDDIWYGATAAILKMYPSVEVADTIRVQFMSFVEKRGKFSSATAKRDARNPNINVLQWWKFHGGDTKELRDMAFKVLAQPISASSVEKPWNTYNFVHNAQQNRLNASHVEDLMFIHSNLRLLSRFSADYNYGPHRKWDVNSEHLILDETDLRWDDIRFLGLDDDSLKQSSQSQNPIQELFRIMEDAPGSIEPVEQSRKTTVGRPRGRGGRASGSRSYQKGKTKKFL